jgi:transposase InsO family protein
VRRPLVTAAVIPQRGDDDGVSLPAGTDNPPPLRAVDDHSRLAYTEVLADEKGATAAAFWLRAAKLFASYGITVIRRCLTDNGACYRSHARAEALAATHNTHKRTRPYTKTNGKVERYNATMSREWPRRAALPQRGRGTRCGQPCVPGRPVPESRWIMSCA